jgi:hypothetical protein
MATNLPEIVQMSRFNGLRDFDAPIEVVEAEKAKCRTELSSIEEASRPYPQETEARAIVV